MKKLIFYTIILFCHALNMDAQIKTYSVSDANQDETVDIADVNQVISTITGNSYSDKRVINADVINTLLSSLNDKISYLEAKQASTDSIVCTLKERIAALEAKHGIGEAESHDTIINVEPNDQQITDNYFNSKNDLKAIISHIYQTFYSFMSNEKIIEGMGLGVLDNTNNNYKITANNPYIKSTWSYGYNVITYCNMIIQNAEAVKKIDSTMTESEYQCYLQHAYCLRSIVYYQMAILWGNIPYITNYSVNTDYNIVQTNQKTIIEECYKLCKDNSSGLDGFGTDENKQYFLSNINIQPIIWEMGFSLGNYYVTRITNKESFILAAPSTRTVSNLSNDYNVVTPGYYTRLIDEFAGSKNADTLASEWTEAYPSFGVWNALLRLNKTPTNLYLASSKLFPIPQDEINVNSTITQNEGY